MKIIVAPLLLAAFALAVPTIPTFDHNVLITFGLISTQSNGGDPTALLNKLLPQMSSQVVVLDRITQIMLLASGGFNSGSAKKMLDKTLPQMAREGKSSDEQMMALMFASKQFCKKSNENCEVDDDVLLPMMTANSERGCREHFVNTNIEITGNDKCVCDKQDRVLVWLSVLDSIRGYGKSGNTNGVKSKIPDQIPIILMLAMQQPCNGTIKGTGHRCKCSSVTEGNEDVLLQYLVNSPGADQILTASAKATAHSLANAPGARALDLSTLLLTQQQNINPSYLSLLLNQGGDTQQVVKQMLLSNIGLDSGMTQLILNGGFNSDTDKVAMINYMANMGIVSVNAVPFILGVDNGIDFYINSLLSQGAIDPLMGSLLLGQQSGATQDEIIDFISQTLLAGKNKDYFKDFGKPYIPNLPAGIYPGSKLYFAHLETLGINTCALHDLRNRFECGFTGIGAAQCEILPYCCYNPVFITDDQVVKMTEGAITSALSIPWCYYNVFFIYYDSFFLSVKKPGQFPSSTSCLPIFKYGLNIDASMYYVYGQSSGSSLLSGLIHERVECGFPGITEFHCVAIRGCCWDKYAPYKVPQCFNANGASAFEYNLDKVPVAYQPVNGTCNTNYFGIPDLYYRRYPCLATFSMFVNGRDILALPDKYECLWQLGCCWEEDDNVGKMYPNSPRCYRREDGTYSSRENNIGQLSSLIARSGRVNENGLMVDQEKFPKAKPDTL